MREGWTYKKLGEVCDVINGLWTGKKEPFITVGVIRNANFTKECTLNLDNVAYIDVEEKQFKTRELQYGDIIIEKSGGSDNQPVGRPVFFYLKEKGYSFSNFTAALRIKELDDIIPPYLHKALLFQYKQGITRKLQSKTTGLHNLNFKAYLNCEIPLPPKSQQEAIVSELDEINSLLGLKREQLQKYDKLAQSLFYEMFGDPVENEKGWEVKNLADLCENKDSLRKPITASERITGSIPYYGASGIVDYVKDYIFDDEYLLVSEDGANLIARSTPIAFSIKGKTWVNNHAHILKFSNYSTQLFVEYNINLRDVSPFITGAVQPKLNQAKMSIIPIPLPPLFLQQQFASRIEQIERQKAKVKEAIEKLDTLLASRMQYWFE